MSKKANQQADNKTKNNNKLVKPVGTPSRIRAVGGEGMVIGGSDVAFETSVKYLGVKIDQTLSMQDQIGSIIMSRFVP